MDTYADWQANLAYLRALKAWAEQMPQPPERLDIGLSEGMSLLWKFLDWLERYSPLPYRWEVSNPYRPSWMPDVDVYEHAGGFTYCIDESVYVIRAPSQKSC